MQYQKIAFIGAGNMSRAIISGLVSNGYPAENIMASNPSRPKLDTLAKDFAIQITQSNADASDFAQVIVLSVKPQLMAQVCEKLAAEADLQNKMFISVAAGITASRLQEMLGENYPLVRVMPNTPCALGMGVSGMFASDEVTPDNKAFADFLMQQTGKTVWVDTESGIDGVIAAAGSSPAYFFYFLEGMQEKAMELGFSEEQARMMVEHTMLGAAQMVVQNQDLALRQLREQVTSKGGTTAEALRTFSQHNLHNTISDAMQAAVDRAEEMSKQF